MIPKVFSLRWGHLIFIMQISHPRGGFQICPDNGNYSNYLVRNRYCVTMGCLYSRCYDVTLEVIATHCPHISVTKFLPFYPHSEITVIIDRCALPCYPYDRYAPHTPKRVRIIHIHSFRCIRARALTSFVRIL